MDEVDEDRELTLNRQAYEQLKESIRHDYAGKYVGLADGRIVASDTDCDVVQKMMSDLVSSETSYYIFQAEDEPWFEPVERTYTEIIN